MSEPAPPNWQEFLQTFQTVVGQLQSEVREQRRASVTQESLETILAAQRADMQNAVVDMLGQWARRYEETHTPTPAVPNPSASSSNGPIPEEHPPIPVPVPVPAPVMREFARPDKDPQLPGFDGTTDALEFFEQCQEIFRAKHTPPEAQLNYGILALKGTARTFIREKQPATFQEMKELLLSRFRLPNENYHLHIKIRSLVMQGENLEGYLKDFKYLAGKLGSALSPSDKFVTFVNGLAPGVSVEVLRAKPTTFDEAEKAALDYFACRRSTRAHVAFQSDIVADVNALYSGFTPRRGHRSNSQLLKGSPRIGRRESRSHSAPRAHSRDRSRSPSSQRGEVHAIHSSGRSSSGDSSRRSFSPRRNFSPHKGKFDFKGKKPWKPRNSQAPQRQGFTRDQFGSNRKPNFQRGGGNRRQGRGQGNEHRPERSQSTQMELDVLTGLLTQARARQEDPQPPNGPQGNLRR